MRKKSARKNTKNQRSAPAQGITIRGGAVQQTLFAAGFRPAIEVRAEQENVVLAGDIPPSVLHKLHEQAAESLEVMKRWEMDHSTKPHRYSWGPGKKHFYTAEESVLHELVDKIAAAAFQAAADRYRPEIAALVERLEKKTRLLRQRRENGQILAEEGRAALKPITDRRAAEVCRIYKRVRPSFPPGKRGNGAAVAEVARQCGPVPGRNSDITTTAIRKILKRCDVSCR